MDEPAPTLSLFSLFNNITYQSNTIDIFSLLDPMDLEQMALVNTFCHKTVRKTKNILADKIEDNMEVGAAVINTLLKWKGKGKISAVLTNSEVVCVLLEGGCVVCDKATHEVKFVLKAKEIVGTSGKGPNINSFIWVRRDTLLIHFSRSTTDNDLFKWVFYNVTTGTVERTFEWSGYPFSFTLCGYRYDSSADTIHFTISNKWISRISWDLKTGKYQTKTLDFLGDAPPKNFAFYGDSAVSMGATLQLWHLSSGTMVHSVAIDDKLKPDSIRFCNNLVALQNSKTGDCFIWKVNGKTLKKIGPVKGKSGEIFFNANLYPSYSPLPLYIIRRNSSENGRFRLQEIDFTNKKKKFKKTSIETKHLFE